MPLRVLPARHVTIPRVPRAARPGIAAALALVLIAVATAATFARHDAPDPLWVAGALVLIAVVGDRRAVRFSTLLHVTSIDVIAQAAALFDGPAAAILVGAGATLVTYGVERLERKAYAPSALAINVAVNSVPAALAALLIGALDLTQGHGEAAFLAGATVLPALAAVGAVLVYGTLTAIRFGTPAGQLITSTARDLGGSSLVQVGIVVAIAVLYDEAQVAGLIVAGIAVLVFGYMASLLLQARTRADQMARMSWGVLSSLVQTMHLRSPATARHCAAVASFSRDIAQRMGLSAEEQDLAHVAGLLHDLGRFAMSDVALNATGTLDDGDWDHIRDHPAVGAALLADLASYGPIAEIVAQHHERIDGQGYPDRRAGQDIHLIARIVAVAEVYDTLTGPDTYREQRTSLEAIQELRRVAGTQLDADVVEVMVSLLAGRGTDYRHAAEADLLAELDLQRALFLRESLERTP